MARRQPAPDYTYDRRIHQFRNTRSGRFVSWAAVREYVTVYADRQEQTARELAFQLQDGAITPEAFFTEMVTLIKDSHGAASMIARGGKAQMSEADWAFTEERVQSELTYLNRFVGQIVREEIPLDGRFVNRAGMYGAAAFHTFIMVDRDENAMRGKTEERNILEPLAHHCTRTPSCPEQTDRGWVPIGELVPTGQRTCLSRCRCHFEYR